MAEATVYINELSEAFQSAGDAKRAAQQSAYMRDQFSFLGIAANARKETLKPFFRKENRPRKKDLEIVVKTLWQKPEREYQYAAQELASKYLRESEIKDIELFEWMITTKSWWDTVDFIAATLVGNYFHHYPESLKEINEKWLKSGNIWLQRSTLIFQLKYKDQVNDQLLKANILALSGSKEFFINKAIGWALREYGKVNPQWVKSFVGKTGLSNLSRREALKRIGTN